MKKILWVDDDVLILSSARRLLQMHGFEIHTLENPRDVLAWLRQNDTAVLVSDQRMPQMTGTELLNTVKVQFPLVTRIMVTGFMDSALIQQSINESEVFRFITKPWGEAEIVTDILQGIEHHEKLLAKENLSIQVREQNRSLQKFTENLEEIILGRTFELSEAKKEQENKNIKIRNLIQFIQDVSELENIMDLIDTFYKDLKHQFPILNCFFAYTDASFDSKILFRIKTHWTEHKIHKMWPFKKDIRVLDKQDQLYISNETKMPVTNVIAIPLLRQVDDMMPPHTLFVETDTSLDQAHVILDFITSRLQVLSLGIERVLSLKRAEFESKRWEKTFDSVSEPLCILNSEKNVIRKNSAFQKQIQNMSSEWFEGHKKILHIESKIYELYFYEIKESIGDKFKNTLCYFRDVTDEKILYQKLLQNEKIAAVGLLAGNIAHELNNPLTGIRSMSQLLIHSETTPQIFKDDLSEIDKACLRCQNVIQSLIDFSDLKENQFSKISVQDVIYKTLPLLKTALRFHNTQIELPERNYFVLGDFKLLQQVIFNLVNNACQAMQHPGTLGIDVRRAKKKIKISISDTGQGVAVEILDKLFEPFITTKKEGEGTGLGLSFCKNVIDKMGGALRLEKSSLTGAIFEIELPEYK